MIFFIFITYFKCFDILNMIFWRYYMFVFIHSFCNLCFNFLILSLFFKWFHRFSIELKIWRLGQYKIFAQLYSKYSYNYNIILIFQITIMVKFKVIFNIIFKFIIFNQLFWESDSIVSLFLSLLTIFAIVFFFLY